MDRRSFLKTTAVGVGAAGAGSCAHLGSTLSSTSAGVLEMVNKLRGTLDSIASPSAQAAVGPHDKLLRDGAQTLVLVGAFHSMAEDVRAHPAVQQLMFENLPMMTSSAQQIQQAAVATTPEERQELTRQLKADPDLVASTAQGLDAEAVRLGLPGELRLRLRGLFFQVGNRMKQSSSLAIEEYSHKVARIEARSAESRGFEREYIARLGEQSFWEFQARHDGYAAAWAGRVPEPQPTPPPLQVPMAAPEVEGRGASGTLHSERDTSNSERHALLANSERNALLANDGSVAMPVGGALLGLGILIGLGGVALFVAVGGIAGGGVFVITAGALLFIAGVITLAIGGGHADRAARMRLGRRPKEWSDK